MTIRWTGLTLATALTLSAFVVHAGDEAQVPGAMTASPTWEELRADVVGEREILDGSGIMMIEAPIRAEDAATVPIRILQKDGTPRIRNLTLVVDQNPSPVVGLFRFGDPIGQVDLETRIRVDTYSNVRAIAETEDGKLYMTGRFVKASGGCSAPASKDAAAALASLGQMKARWYGNEPARSGARLEAQVMLRHPNYSGLQRDQLTNMYEPANFVDRLEVRQGETLLFSMEGGISISEDPTFRFRYTETGNGEPITVDAHDTENRTFQASFPIGS